MNAMNPQIHNLVQGSEPWHQFRASHFTASDAPAVMGASKYRSRGDLLREKSTGIAPEISAAQQRLFDQGHEAEAAVRPRVEEMIDSELFPVTVSNDVDGLPLSASMDGLTMDGEIGFECKLWNEHLAEQVRAGELEPHYYWQLEHQLLVSRAQRIIFATGDADRLETMEYRPVPGRADALIAGWKQFEQDLADHVPASVEAKPAGRSPETLPALRIEAKGMVTASNMAEFREHAMAVLGQINRDLQTDEDFADAESTVKWCSGVEDRLSSAKANVLAQMADVDAVCRTIDDVQAETRRIRLELDRLVKAEKENRKAQIVQAGVDAVRAHYAATSQTLGAYPSCLAFPAGLPAEIGASIKGLKTLTSMREKVDAAVANAKIAASQKADAIRINAAILDEHKEHAFLFTDCARIVAEKSADDLRNLVAARIAEHKAREEAKLEAERQRIRAEEQAKAERAARDELERERAAEAKTHEKPLPPVTMTVVQPQAFVAPAQPAAPPSSRTIKLGDVNAALAPLSITAEGLASIGFASCGQDRAAKLYQADDLPRILHKLSDRLRHLALQAAA